MATTNLIVDFLVIGIVSSIWLTPIALLALDGKAITQLSNAGTASIPFILAFAYILGIAVSRLADSLTNRWNDKWRNDVFGNKPAVSYHNQLNTVISRSSSASEYLGYRRSVVRTARACAVNFLFAAVLWIVIAVFGSDEVSGTLSWLIAVCSGFFAVLLLMTWKTVLRGYFHGIKDLYNCLS